MVGVRRSGMLGVMKRYTERERERLVVESESWNGSVADFCRQRGVSAGSLALWRRRYGARNAGSKDEAVRGTWIPVEEQGVGPDVGEMPRYVLVSPVRWTRKSGHWGLKLVMMKGVGKVYCDGASQLGRFPIVGSPNSSFPPRFVPVILKNNQRKLLHLVQNSLNRMRSSAN
jgi:hypothetical protein